MTNKILIYRNQDYIMDITAKHESVLPLFQSFVSECKIIDIPISNATISEAISNAEHYAINQFRKQLPEPEIKTIGKFKTKPVDILSTVQLPSLDRLIKFANDLKKVSDSIPFIDIENYKCTLSTEGIERITETASYYIESKDEIEDYNVINEVCQALDKMQSFLFKKYGENYQKIQPNELDNYFVKRLVNGKFHFGLRIDTFENRLNKNKFDYNLIPNKAPVIAGNKTEAMNRTVVNPIGNI